MGHVQFQSWGHCFGEQRPYPFVVLASGWLSVPKCCLLSAYELELCHDVSHRGVGFFFFSGIKFQ